MNGNTRKTIGVGLAVLLIGALWTGNAQLASMETSIQYISKQVDDIAAGTKENSKRILDLEREQL